MLQFKKNIYIIFQVRYNWNELLKAGLIQLSIKQSEVDPCLYYLKDDIYTVYVDNTIFGYLGDI